jgi:hypothetical protein
MMRVARAKVAEEEKTIAALHSVTYVGNNKSGSKCVATNASSTRLLKQYHDSMGSSVKRLWSKVKHTEPKDKDLTEHQAARKRAYTEAHEVEESCRLRVRVLAGKEAELVQQVKYLQPEIAEHMRLRADLDALYARMFRNAVAGTLYPEQEVASCAFESARAWLREVEPELEAESAVRERIVTAYESLCESERKLRFVSRQRQENEDKDKIKWQSSTDNK